MQENAMKYEMLPLDRINRGFEPGLSAAVNAVIRSGHFIGGPTVARFESQLSDLCGVDYAVGVSTGLDALRLTLRAMVICGMIEAGDGVIVPANSFIASALAIVDAGLKPVFADPSETDFLLHADEIERRACEGVKAVMPVDLYGRIAATDSMLEVCRSRGLLIIEDAAQAIGASRRLDNGTIVNPGQWSDAAAFSFYPAKNVGALGDGGAVVTRHSELAATIRALANYGESQRYHCTLPGFNCRLDPIQAAALSVKLPRVGQENSARRRNALLYRSMINADERLILPPEPEDGDAVHQFVVRCVGVDRDRFRSRLGDRGVATAIHYPVAIDRQEAMRDYAGTSRCEIAARLSHEVVSLPVSSATSPDDIRAISAIINETLEDI